VLNLSLILSSVILEFHCKLGTDGRTDRSTLTCRPLGYALPVLQCIMHSTDTDEYWLVAYS